MLTSLWKTDKKTSTPRLPEIKQGVQKSSHLSSNLWKKHHEIKSIFQTDIQTWKLYHFSYLRWDKGGMVDITILFQINRDKSWRLQEIHLLFKRDWYTIFCWLKSLLVDLINSIWCISTKKIHLRVKYVAKTFYLEQTLLIE